VIPVVIEFLCGRGTFDEDDKTDGNHIPTIVAGAHVRPGVYRTRMDHYDLPRTLQDMYHLPPLGFAARRSALGGLFDDLVDLLPTICRSMLARCPAAF
jgi:hypothetical protein